MIDNDPQGTTDGRNAAISYRDGIFPTAKEIAQRIEVMGQRASGYERAWLAAWRAQLALDAQIATEAAPTPAEREVIRTKYDELGTALGLRTGTGTAPDWLPKDAVPLGLLKSGALFRDVNRDALMQRVIQHERIPGQPICTAVSPVTKEALWIDPWQLVVPLRASDVLTDFHDDRPSD